MPFYRLTVDSATTEELVIAIRKPDWLDQASIKINDQIMEAVEDGGYLLIKRSWQANDRVELNLKYKVSFIGRSNKSR
jgi:DUF1680 family protein